MYTNGGSRNMKFSVRCLIGMVAIQFLIVVPIFILFSNAILWSQTSYRSSQSASSYSNTSFRSAYYPSTKDSIGKDFDSQFKNSDDKTNYKRLREYLSLKNEKLRSMTNQFVEIKNYKIDINRYLEGTIRELSSLRKQLTISKSKSPTPQKKDIFGDLFGQTTDPESIQRNIESDVRDSVEDSKLAIQSDLAER